MTEPADPALETPAEGAPKKKPARRKTPAATTTTRAKKSKAAKTPEVETVAETPAPQKPAATEKPAPKARATRKKKPAAPVEDASVEALASKAASIPFTKAEPEAAPAPATASVEASATAAPTEAPAAPPAMVPRRYPVYIPRTVAKQMEAEGKQIGVSVNSGEEVPHDLLEKIAAATPPPQARRERHQHQHQHQQPQNQPQPQQQPQPVSDGLPAGLGMGDGSLPPELISAPPVDESEPKPEELSEGEGIIEISGKGFGFLRDAKRNFIQTPNDIFVTPEIVKQFQLRDGQMLRGVVRRGPRGSQLHKLLTINGDPAEKVKNLPAFDELTVISPEPRITMETTADRYTTRIIDLMCPIGRGQRALVVAPPRTGKTTFLIHMAEAVMKNHQDLHLMFLLIDERPEEVTDIRRSVPGAEIFASSNDNDVKSHTRIAQLAIERARRLVEQGKHVFILLDSITRVGRAFNNAMTGGGRTGSGGLDSRALEIPRRLFASARNTEEAGSLTIVGTTLVETNSRGDEVIFQEFKGTGNMELVLDRRIAEQRVYPAIDIFMSGTRREELLIPEEDLHKIHIIRRGLAGYKPLEAVERLLFFLKKFPTNAQMLAGIPG